MTVALSHKQLIAGRHPLPLRWLRLPLLLATVGLSCVCIAVGVQALDRQVHGTVVSKFSVVLIQSRIWVYRSSKLENSIRDMAEDTGSAIVFDMNDIKATSIVLTLVGFLIDIVASVFSFSLAYDFFTYLRTRPDTTAVEDEKAQIIPRLPWSTRTLRFQTIALSFLSVWLFAVLIPSTVFSRTGSAHLTIHSNSPDSMVIVDPVYWDYGFLRCLAAAPWFTLVFSVPASIVTWVAWKYSPTMPTD